MPAKITINLEILKELYCDKNILIKEIARKFNCDQRVVIRTIKENNLLRNYQNPVWLKKMHYDKKITITKMSELANCNHHSITKYMRINGLDTLDEVRYSGVTKYTVNKSYFDIIDSSEKAYWLGYIVADGSIIYEKCNTYRLDLTISRADKGQLEKFKKCIGSNAPISERETYISKTGKSYPGVRLRINNTYLCKSLMKLGVLPKKSAKEIFPDIPEIYYKDFILGVFDGDGSFSHWNYNRYDNYYSQLAIVGSYSLMSDISNYINKKFNLNINVRKDGKISRIAINNGNAGLVMNWLYQNSSLFLHRKYEKYIEWNYLDELNHLVYNFKNRSPWVSILFIFFK